jgi:hypothetical protein
MDHLYLQYNYYSLRSSDFGLITINALSLLTSVLISRSYTYPKVIAQQ